MTTHRHSCYTCSVNIVCGRSYCEGIEYTFCDRDSEYGEAWMMCSPNVKIKCTDTFQGLAIYIHFNNIFLNIGTWKDKV